MLWKIIYCLSYIGVTAFLYLLGMTIFTFVTMVFYLPYKFLASWIEELVKQFRNYDQSSLE